MLRYLLHHPLFPYADVKRSVCIELSWAILSINDMQNTNKASTSFLRDFFLLKWTISLMTLTLLQDFFTAPDPTKNGG